jgi:hypothetical protein
VDIKACEYRVLLNKKGKGTKRMRMYFLSSQ